MGSTLKVVAIGVLLSGAACSPGWAASHPPGRYGVAAGGEFVGIAVAGQKAAAAADDGAVQDCLTPCPAGLTCDEQTGECVRSRIAPPEGGPQLHGAR